LKVFLTHCQGLVNLGGGDGIEWFLMSYLPNASSIN